MKTKKITLMALLLGFALIIFVVEMQLPPLAPIPGIKLGLANVITLIAIYMLGRKEAFIILILKIIIGAVFSGNMPGFIYSLSGGMLSFAVMGFVSLFLDRDKIWVISILGAIGHNIGQILAACFITGLMQIIWYLPVLMISAVITGFFTGNAAQFALKRLNNI